MTEGSWLLIVLAATIGVGSFLFHTCVTSSTMWLDIIPIALFQIAFFWLAGRYMLNLPVWPTPHPGTRYPVGKTYYH